MLHYLHQFICQYLDLNKTPNILPVIAVLQSLDMPITLGEQADITEVFDYLGDFLPSFEMENVVNFALDGIDDEILKEKELKTCLKKQKHCLLALPMEVDKTTTLQEVLDNFCDNSHPQFNRPIPRDVQIEGVDPDAELVSISETNKIINRPTEFFISLKRFTPEGSKIRSEIKEPMTLSLQEDKHILSEKSLINTYIYNLTSFSVHLGSSQNGHYVSYVKKIVLDENEDPVLTAAGKIKYKWFLCDDLKKENQAVDEQTVAKAAADGYLFHYSLAAENEENETVKQTM